MAELGAHEFATLGGLRVLTCALDGPVIGERTVSDVIGEAFSGAAQMVAIPVARLDPGFLDLKTRIAGEVLQKFVNYGFRVAIVGDVSAQAGASQALTDFIRESNRGKTVWFVADLAELEARLDG